MFLLLYLNVMLRASMTNYEKHIDFLLYEWGRWAQASGVNLNIKTGVLGRIKGSTVKSASICDDDALAIDAAVSSLKAESDLYNCAISLYVYNSTYREAARRIKKSHVTIGKYKIAVINHVAELLPIHLRE